MTLILDLDLDILKTYLHTELKTKVVSRGTLS